jgi:hypothetical protein
VAGDADAVWAEATIAALLYPPGMAGESILGSQAFVVGPVLILAAAVMGAALIRIDSRDIPLEAAQ